MSAPVTHLKIENQRWEVVPEFASLLPNVLSNSGEPVKNTPSRSVSRHRIGDEVFYVKTYRHHATLFTSLKHFVKKSRSRAEWKLAPRLEAFGIRVVPHLAHGERWTFCGLQESMLVTKGPKGFEPLAAADVVSSIQAPLGKFIQQLHRSAVFHDDLQISNLLYSREKNEFCLVDLDNIKISATPLHLEERLDNLATLNRRCPLEREFFEAYGDGFLRYQNKLARRTDKKLRKSIPRKLNLLFQTRQAFAPKQIGDLKWHVRIASLNNSLRDLLNDPDKFLASRARLLKNGTRSTVGCADGFVLKRFNFKKVSTVVFDLLRPTRARRGFRTARHLELLSIQTPQAIAYADRRRFGFVLQSYFVMKEVPGAAYLWERPEARRDLILRLAELIAKTHREGFSHRDLKETNLIVDAANQPYLIDLDALRYVRRISDLRAASELARLAQGFSRRIHLKPKEQLMFIKTYCDCRGIEHWRSWWVNAAKKILPSRSK